MRAQPAPARVAVLLSTFNGEAFLEAQLESLAAQDGVDLRVFVRDDGSTDATLAILARFAALWPDLATPLRGPRLGPAMSFLELLRSIPDTFDGYAFCDQDDVWLPDKLRRATGALAAEACAGPVLYCSRVMCVDRDLRPLGASPLDADGRFEHLLFENIAFGNTVVMNAAARSAIVADLPGRGAIMHDWWCALVISALGVVLYDEVPSVLYRQHQGNAIGAAVGRLGEIANHLKTLRRDPRRFYPIHAQAEAFLRLHGARARAEARSRAEALVASRRSLAARLAFAARGPVIRRRRLDAIAGRLLLAMGLY
jgi:glycosyltransferase involved in cell wall biosynthesis